jgi:hypothetical protein
MGITTQALREWLERTYDGYAVEGEPAHGTYGLIWFLTARSANPAKFAVKTVAPEKIAQGSTADDVTFLRREFRMWLALPHTYNVLPALGFDFAHLSDDTLNASVDLPVMRMPRMDGSLEEWVTKPSPAQIADRLVALAQALNGLQCLYDHGFEGHGDLKPSNLLYDDLRHKSQLEEKMSWPSTLHPWRIRVADLGWADAWVDLGFSDKVLRNYMAPERLDRTVVRIKSDMFSMGVIACELLQGHHPADNLKKALGSEGKWKRWVQNGERNLRQIQSPRLQRIIERCLDPNPDSRPDSLEFLDELCAELRSTHRLDVAETLGRWRSGASGGDLVAQHEHEAWAAVQSPCLGAAETRASLQQISKKMEQVNVVDFEGCEVWAPLADAFVHLTPGTPEEQDRIRKLASDHLVTILGPLDRSAIRQLGHRSDWPALREFERFSMLVKGLADIAEIGANDSSDLSQKLGPYARAALYYGFASDLRLQRGNQVAIEMLSFAIVEAPNEPVNYYFRARWSNETRMVSATMPSQASTPAHSSIKQIAQDLETAIRLDPDWEEPRRLLGSLRGERPA